jgi:magnesium-transporting ATPase (P-type)
MDDRNWRRLRSRGVRLPARSYGRGDGGGAERKHDWLGIIGQLSALTAVLVGSIYILGLLSLFVPLAINYTKDLTTAWYAVSLLPRPVVAGQGVLQLLSYPLLLTVVSVLSLLGFGVLARRTRRRFPKRGRLAYIVISIGLMGLVVAAWIYILWYYVGSLGGYQAYVEKWYGPNHPVFEALLNYVVSCVVLLFVVLRGQFTAQRGLDISSERLLPRVSNRADLFKGVLICWGGLLIIAVFQLFLMRPPLPKVEVTSEMVIPGMDQNPAHLLTHTDGFWYVFNQDGALIAIPDAEVKSVQVTASGKEK